MKVPIKRSFFFTFFMSKGTGKPLVSSNLGWKLLKDWVAGMWALKIDTSKFITTLVIKIIKSVFDQINEL